MSSDTTRDRFVSPECEETTTVDPSARRALVEHGCVLCGTGIPSESVGA